MVRYFSRFAAAVLFLTAFPAFPQSVITTVAGRDWIFPPPGGPAVSAPLSNVTGVAMDASGNLFVADPQNNAVLKIDSAGNIALFAGNGIQGFSGEGGPAISASLFFPRGVALDGKGNLYITDLGNERIRRVDASGTITTVAGNGQRGFSGDGGPAFRAVIFDPAGIAADSAGNVYFADSGNGRVRKIDPNGNITTVAGTLANPQAVTVDGQGNLYFSDAIAIRKLAADGSISTVAQVGQAAGLIVDGAGNLIVSDTAKCVIRSISPSGSNAIIAGSNGNCTYGGDGAAPQAAAFWFPAGLAIGPSGNIIVADRGNQRVRQFNPSGTVSTLAGNNTGYRAAVGTTPTQSFLYGPQGIAYGQRAQHLLIAESRANAIREVSLPGVDNVIKNVAGFSLVGGYSRDGVPGSSTLLNSPYGVAIGFDGSTYYADTFNNVIRNVSADGTVVKTVAGQFSAIGGFGGDIGAATSAQLNQPYAILPVIGGSFFIADTLNNRIRLVDSNGFITTYAGTGTAGFSGDGGPASMAQINRPFGMTFDSHNNLYFADQGNHRIRKISPDRTITTVAGNGLAGGPFTENVKALAANVDTPFAIAFDSVGNMYYSENATHRVRKVDVSGTVTTVVGNGNPGFTGDGGLATAALVSYPAGLVVVPGSPEVLYIADSGNDRIRAVFTAKPSIMASASTLVLSAGGGVSSNPPQLVNVSAVLNGAPLTGLGFVTSVTADAKWLTVTPSSGTLPQTLLISADASSLLGGRYIGTVTITAPGATPPSVTIAVSLTVSPTVPPTLTSNTKGISLSVSQGSAPLTSSISLANTGGGSINFNGNAQTASGGGWLSLSAPAGTVNSATPSSLTVNVDPSSLAPGNYSGSVTVSGTSSLGGIVPVVVPVSLIVSQSAHVIQLSQTALSFTTMVGGSSPLSQTFGIQNIGNGGMNWNAAIVNPNGGAVPWLTISSTSGSVNTPFTDSSQVTLSVNPGRMGSGDYYAKVQITSDADNSPQTVAVLFTIKPGSTPAFADVQPSALIFSGPSGTVPSSQIVRIAAVAPATGGSITYDSSSVTQDGVAWLVHVPRSNTIQVNSPDRIVVQPDFTSLAPGTYNGSITLVLGDGSTRTLKIMSVVTAPLSGASVLRSAAACSNSALRVQFSPPLLQGSNTFSALAGQQNTLFAKVLFDCSGGTFTAKNGQVNAYFKDGEPPLPFAFNAGDGMWAAPWSPPDIGKSPISMVLTAAGVNGTNPVVGQSDIFVASLSPGARVPLPNGVVSAASFQSNVPIGVGGLISIFGSQMIDGGNGQAGSVPLPQTLNGTQVLIENQPVPILYASPTQINVQVPYEVNVNVPQHLIVQRNGAVSGPFTVPVASVQPAIFLAGGTQGVIVSATTNALANPANPAKTGDFVIIYCTGLGPTNPQPASGTAATDAASITSSVSATIGGQPSTLVYAGLTPGFPGLYQINAQVPAGISGDALPVVVTVAGVSSPPATMAVH